MTEENLTEKTAIETAKTTTSPVNGAEIPLGAHPGNTGGKPGRSGRKPIAFKEACRGIVDEYVLPDLEIYVRGHTPDDPGYRWAADRLMLYGHGKPGVSDSLPPAGSYGVLRVREPLSPEEWARAVQAHRESSTPL